MIIRIAFSISTVLLMASLAVDGSLSEASAAEPSCTETHYARIRQWCRQHGFVLESDAGGPHSIPNEPLQSQGRQKYVRQNMNSNFLCL
jgi:hypothetical protein